MENRPTSKMNWGQFDERVPSTEVVQIYQMTCICCYLLFARSYDQLVPRLTGATDGKRTWLVELCCQTSLYWNISWSCKYEQKDFFLFFSLVQRRSETFPHFTSLSCSALWSHFVQAEPRMMQPVIVLMAAVKRLNAKFQTDTQSG